MLSASCHCGAVRIELAHRPEFVVDCNCSICRRYATRWAFYTPDAVRFYGHPEHTRAYIWGPRTIRTWHCATCACVMHWDEIQVSATPRIGVNLRNVEYALWSDLRVRRFDGAETWAYLDD